WTRESGSELIHPDDLAVVLAHYPLGHVCEVVGREGEYLLMRYAEYQFRGKPDLFESLPPPAFRLGEAVATRTPRTRRSGLVRDIGWHFNCQEYIFTLIIDGKRFKSRYRAEEL